MKNQNKATIGIMQTKDIVEKNKNFFRNLQVRIGYGELSTEVEGVFQFLIDSAKVQNNIVRPIITQRKSFQVLALSKTYITKITARVIVIAQKILDHLNFSFIPATFQLGGTL